MNTGFNNLDYLGSMLDIVVSQHRQHVDQRLAVEGQVGERRTKLLHDLVRHFELMKWIPP